MTVDGHDRRGRIRSWCALSSFDVESVDGARLRVVLDRDADLVVEIEVGSDDEPVRVHNRFVVPPAHLPGLSGDVIESVVLGRSSMIDARLVPAGGVETVVAVYPDGLSRHTFLTALFEVQKVRDLIGRAAEIRAADAETLARLETLVASPD